MNQIDYIPTSKENAKTNPPGDNYHDIVVNMDESVSENQPMDEKSPKVDRQKPCDVERHECDTLSTATKQWKLVALMLDRVFAIVFLIVNIAIVVVLFPKS